MKTYNFGQQPKRPESAAQSHKLSRFRPIDHFLRNRPDSVVYRIQIRIVCRPHLYAEWNPESELEEVSRARCVGTPSC